MNSHEVFIHIHQGCFAGTGAIVRLPQCQWSKPDGYGKSSQCTTTTKHSKAKTVCTFLGIYCIALRWCHIKVMYSCRLRLYELASNDIVKHCYEKKFNETWHDFHISIQNIYIYIYVRHDYIMINCNVHVSIKYTSWTSGYEIKIKFANEVQINKITRYTTKQALCRLITGVDAINLPNRCNPYLRLWDEKQILTSGQTTDSCCVSYMWWKSQSLFWIPPQW